MHTLRDFYFFACFGRICIDIIKKYAELKKIFKMYESQMNPTRNSGHISPQIKRKT